MHRSIETTPWQVSTLQASRVAAPLCNFLDLASTSMGRATHYNSAEAQAQAEALGHEALFSLDRGLYTAMLMLPGMTDRARAIGVRRLLASVR